MKVLFSQPLTLTNAAGLPDYLDRVASERAMSYSYGQRWPRSMSEHILRSSLAVSLMQRRPRYDAVITGRYGEWFAMTQALWPFGRRPHLLLDVEWPYRHNRFVRRWVSRLFHRLVACGAWKIQVFCHGEADNYASAYGIDRERFVWIPYCTDLDQQSFRPREEDYIFTGGRQQRDYRTLAKAVSGLDIPVRVAAPLDQIEERCRPPNMQVLGRLSRDEFFAQLAGARLVVLSLQDGLLRYPGVITYVSALRLGKCVILNEPHGGRSYIDTGRTGVLVPPQDADSLANAILETWESRRRRQEMAENAAGHAAEHFSLARWFRDLDRLTEQMTGASFESG